MGRNNWARNLAISRAAQSILKKSKSPRVVKGRREQYEYIKEMRSRLVEKTNCNAETATRHISRYSWYKQHKMKIRN